MVNPVGNHHQAMGAPGSNPLELLLFRLEGPQVYGINVARVREVIRCPELRHLPDAGPTNCGVVTLRGNTFAVTDTALAIGKSAITNVATGFVIVTASGHATHGLLVRDVERIIKVSPADLQAPPKGISPASYLVSVITFEGLFVEIIDFDRILRETLGHSASDKHHPYSAAG
ncbi:MAG: two-component system chemotaxis family response regulator CheV [Gammaproteobacteria bacterium]|nr:MAG: two-component system chemotaxis family response regulator CheV [Gammaproteobacteria bacterium]TND06694.1 MAG: two-component system, chemotaxis family, response regulator CheV [Gammaproteobacteria bacterium]